VGLTIGLTYFESIRKPEPNLDRGDSSETGRSEGREGKREPAGGETGNFWDWFEQTALVTKRRRTQKTDGRKMKNLFGPL